MNTAATRKEANNIIKEQFGDPYGCWFPPGPDGPSKRAMDLDFVPFAVALDDHGKMASVCSLDIYKDDQLEPGVPSWAEIKITATHKDFEKQGYAKAAVRASLLYVKAHTVSPNCALYADTAQNADGGCAVDFWQHLGWKLRPNRMEDKVDPNGARSVWMEANIDEVLANIGEDTHMAVIIEAGAYDKIRCKIANDKRTRTFELRYMYTYDYYGWSTHQIDSVPTLNGSGAIDWNTVCPVLRQMGILRQDVEAAIAKQPNKPVALSAGSREKTTPASASLETEMANVKYRQLDTRETDEECVIKAAASGIAAAAGPDSGLDGLLMANATRERKKIKNIAMLLRELSINSEKFLRGTDATTRDEILKVESGLFLAKVVDQNGTGGHCIFVDANRKVIIDPENAKEVALTLRNLHRCAGPWSMCCGLHHVLQITLPLGGPAKRKSEGSPAKGKRSKGTNDVLSEIHNDDESEMNVDVDVSLAAAATPGGVTVEEEGSHDIDTSVDDDVWEADLAGRLKIAEAAKADAYSALNFEALRALQDKIDRIQKQKEEKENKRPAAAGGGAAKKATESIVTDATARDAQSKHPGRTDTSVRNTSVRNTSAAARFYPGAMIDIGGGVHIVTKLVPDSDQLWVTHVETPLNPSAHGYKLIPGDGATVHVPIHDENLHDQIEALKAMGYKVNVTCGRAPDNVEWTAAVEVQDVGDMGHGVVARQTISAGEVVLSERKVFQCKYKNRIALAAMVLIYICGPAWRRDCGYELACQY